MQIIRARNVHSALPEALRTLLNVGHLADSRNGPVMVAPTPVTSIYHRPEERVMFWRQRDANPFFHLMESLWMLAGHNDVPYLTQFVKRMAEFSDDGKTFNAAYGFRWREHFGLDQLDRVIKRLRADPTDRRAIVGMWDSREDLRDPDAADSKDLPCNLVVHFQIGSMPSVTPDSDVEVQGVLNMTVFNRSNDIIWGCYGANAVHFSFLQEYVARCVGVPVGQYYQISNNWHAYVTTLEPLKCLASEALDGYKRFISQDFYTLGYCKPYPLISTSKQSWDLDLALFMEDPGAVGFNDPFFRKIAKPMYCANKAYKVGSAPKKIRCDAALEILRQMPEDNDWRMAATDWVEQRAHAHRTAVADGGSHHAAT